MITEFSIFNTKVLKIVRFGFSWEIEDYRKKWAETYLTLESRRMLETHRKLDFFGNLIEYWYNLRDQWVTLNRRDFTIFNTKVLKIGGFGISGFTNKSWRRWLDLDLEKSRDPTPSRLISIEIKLNTRFMDLVIFNTKVLKIYDFEFLEKSKIIERNELKHI